MNMHIVYASSAQHDQTVRHISYSKMETLCGKYAGPEETLALPVNCDECRTKNGELNRARRNAPQSGYTPCACRDCMDTTVSSDTSEPELCTLCDDAGCVAWEQGSLAVLAWECQRDDAYGDDVGDAGTGHGSYEYRSGA